MTTQEYLEQIQTAVARAERAQSTLRIMDRYELPPPLPDWIRCLYPPSPELEAREKQYLENLNEARESYKAQIKEYAGLASRISGQIEALEDSQLKDILIKRYCLGLSFKEIAKQNYYTTRWAYVLHKRALSAFAEAYEISDNS